MAFATEDFETILAEVTDRTGVITVNRPEKRNALSRTVLSEISAVLDAWQDDPAVQAVVFTGAGEKAFVAGADTDQPAGLLLERCAAFGVRVELGVQIAALEGDKAVTGVKLGSGEVIPADLVVVSCGIRANTAVAQAAGVAVERAIVVNEAMDASQQRRKVMDKFLLMLLYVQ